MSGYRARNTVLAVLAFITRCVATDLLSTNEDSGRNFGNGRIVGGTNAVLGRYPYQGLLLIDGNNGGSVCGCVLVRSNWVLSAAHCTIGKSASDLRTVFGSINFLDNGNEPTRQEVTVSTLYNHENYNDRTLQNDISLFQLTSTLTLSNAVTPISLPASGDSLTGINTASCWISGWGATMENGQVSNVLQRADIPLVSNSQCDSSLTITTITNTQICAGWNAGGVDTCQGDSGGPLACASLVDNSWVIIGITSFGVGCARPNSPGVYTRVSSYVTWINEKIDGSPGTTTTITPVELTMSGCRSIQWNPFLAFTLLAGLEISMF